MSIPSYVFVPLGAFHVLAVSGELRKIKKDGRGSVGHALRVFISEFPA